MIRLGIDLGFEYNGETVDELFEKYTKSKIRYYGGYHGLSETVDKEWSSSIYKNPWLLGGRLRSTSDLIYNDDIKIVMERAIQNFLTNAALSEISHLVSIYGEYYYFVDEGRVSSIKKEIESQIIRTPAANKVSLLNDKVEKLVDEINWRLDFTKLCMQWKPLDQNSRDCKAINQTLCAKKNEMTLLFRQHQQFGR
jgi:hypothetical protein